jgi:hypothetical protein
LGTRSFVKAGLAALLTTGFLLVAAPGTGTAAPSPGPAAPSAKFNSSVAYDWNNTKTPPTRAQLQRGIDEVIARMPGAHQIDARTVELTPGLRMKFRSPVEDGVAKQDAVEACVCNVGNTAPTATGSMAARN